MEPMLRRILENQMILLRSIHVAVPSGDVYQAIHASHRMLTERQTQASEGGQFGSSGCGQQAYSSVDVQR